ncbi:MAG: DNA polymerase III subunit delta [Candidatus Saccharimonadales bacterium]
MVVTLTGANEFLLRSALGKLTTEFIDIHGDIAVERLDAEESNFDQFRESLQSTPFLTARKMVILRNPSINKQFAEQAEELLKELPTTTDLILLELKLDKRLSYYKLLKKSTDFQEFAELNEEDLVKWLIETAQSKNGNLTSANARFLVQRVGMNQQMLDNELEKLLLYAPDISQVNIELLTELTPQSKIFELLDVAFTGNLERSIKLYNDQRQQRVEPKIIISMLSWQLKALSFVKTATGRSSEAIAKEAKLHPVVVRKSQITAARISFEKLKQLIADLLTIDVRSKRENIDLDEALQFFLIKIAA